MVQEDVKDTAVETAKPKGVRIGVMSVLMVVFAAIVSGAFIYGVYQIGETYSQYKSASENYIMCEKAANDMKEASNYLTIQTRGFVVNQDLTYLENYFWEANENLRREKAVETLKTLAGGSSEYLESALRNSVDLMESEYYAMKLVIEAKGYKVPSCAAALDDTELSPEDEALSAVGKLDRASGIVFGEEYLDCVTTIEGDVLNCKESLLAEIDAVQDESSAAVQALLSRQRVLTGVLFCVFVAMILLFSVLVLKPLNDYVASIRKNDPLPDTGACELRYLADSYNVMYEENMKSHDALRRKAEHDHLTGLYNRSVFEKLLSVYREEPYALLLIDVDYFKEVNDSHGHDVGDAVLQKVSALLGHAFRATDYPCRVGGDEFAVIMTEVTSDLDHVVSAKIKSVTDGLADASDGLPAATLSIGVAFNDGTLDGETVFKRADKALYEVKEAGRNGHRFYKQDL